MLALLAALAALATPAQAEGGGSATPGLVAEWRALCASHRADFGKSLDQAQAAGWMVAPDAIVAKLTNAEMGKPEVRLRSTASGMHMMLVGTSNRVPGAPADFPVRLRYCGIGAIPAEEGVAAQVAAFAAVPPNKEFASDADTVAYVYRDGPQGREAILSKPDDAEARKLLGDGRMNMIMVKTGGGPMSLVLFAVPGL